MIACRGSRTILGPHICPSPNRRRARRTGGNPRRSAKGTRRSRTQRCHTIPSLLQLYPIVNKLVYRTVSTEYGWKPHYCRIGLHAACRPYRGDPMRLPLHTAAPTVLLSFFLAAGCNQSASQAAQNPDYFTASNYLTSSNQRKQLGEESLRGPADCESKHAFHYKPLPGQGIVCTVLCREDEDCPEGWTCVAPYPEQPTDSLCAPPPDWVPGSASKRSPHSEHSSPANLPDTVPSAPTPDALDGGPAGASQSATHGTPSAPWDGGTH